MKNHKYSAYIEFKSGRNYMEFSNSRERLEKLILELGATKVQIFDNKKKLTTLKKKQH